MAAGYASCPDCGYEFPPPERNPHEPEASSASVLSGQVTNTVYEVQDVTYYVHTKRGAGADTPKTMRVEYQVDFNEFLSRLAQERRESPLDTLCALSLEEDLKMRVSQPVANDDVEAVATGGSLTAVTLMVKV